MKDVDQVWECCESESAEGKHSICCMVCNKLYHTECILLSNANINKQLWICPACMKDIPSSKSATPAPDPTPVRNVSQTRGSKRAALNSPPALSTITQDDVRVIIRQELQSVLLGFKNSIISELKPIREEISGIRESMSFINEEFEKIKLAQQSSNNEMLELKKENQKLKETVTELNFRVNYMEQQSRSNNIEVHCVPENKHENLYSILTQLGSAVGCNLKEGDITHATRVAKRNKDSERPRSIVVQLGTPRLRDQLLASTLQHNKTHKDNKLNTSDLGLAGHRKPVFVVEHLSHANKELHAATRKLAKEKQYKFVWVRGGKIFVRKNEESEFINIKNQDTLKKNI